MKMKNIEYYNENYNTLAKIQFVLTKVKILIFKTILLS